MRVNLFVLPARLLGLFSETRVKYADAELLYDGSIRAHDLLITRHFHCADRRSGADNRRHLIAEISSPKTRVLVRPYCILHIEVA